MPLHPAAPEDLPGLVSAYQQTSRPSSTSAARARTRDFDLPTACPGWTVKDQISHVVGAGVVAAHRWPCPGSQLPDYGHVQSD